MSLGFERPLMAGMALLIIPLLVYGARFFKNPFTVSVPLGAPGGIPFKSPLKIEGLIKALRFLEYAGIVLLCIGLSGPQVVITKTVWLNRGADILFVLDISPSMAALDMNGVSRFNAARGLIKDFAERRPTDSIGLAAVGSEAVLLLPPVTDRQALVSRLEQLRIAELGDGTALGDGLAIAAFHLEKSVTASAAGTSGGAVPRRAVILITDGENNAGAVHPETAAALLGSMGISLWVIGIGSSGEVPIDYVNPVTGMRRSGIFDSRFNEEALQGISRAGNGRWLSAPSAPALNEAFARINDQEMVVNRAGSRTSRRPCHAPFLLAAAGLLAGVKFIRQFLLGAPA
jgi:Ca-activated chloride channel family protein